MMIEHQSISLSRWHKSMNLIHEKLFSDDSHEGVPKIPSIKINNRLEDKENIKKNN